MIQILNVANELEKILKGRKGTSIHDYKIYIRLNLDLDLYVIGGERSYVEELEKNIMITISLLNI